MTDWRPPVVTDIDRQWALDKCPAWAVRRSPEHETTADAGPLVWDEHVENQIERFEAEFATDRRSPERWSELWRKAWWPKADPSLRWPVAGRAPAVPGKPGKPRPLVPVRKAIHLTSRDPSWQEWMLALETRGSPEMRAAAVAAGALDVPQRWPTDTTPLPRVPGFTARGKSHAARDAA